MGLLSPMASGRPPYPPPVSLLWLQSLPLLGWQAHPVSTFPVSSLPTPQLSLLTEALTWIGSRQIVPLSHPTVAKPWLSLLWLYDPAFWWLPRDWEPVNEASSRWKPMDKFFPFSVPIPHHRLLEEAVVSASLKVSVRPGNPFGNTPDWDIFVLSPSGPHPMFALITASPDFTSRQVWAGRPQAQSDAGSLGEGGSTTYRKYSGRKERTDSNTPKIQWPGTILILNPIILQRPDETSYLPSGNLRDIWAQAPACGNRDPHAHFL